MRITKISLQGFRAFDEPFEVDLKDGRHLLLYGENGSGKSSLYFALKRFFEECGDDIAKHRNHFSPVARNSHVRVHVKGEDSTGTKHDREFHWDITDGHPLPVPPDPALSPISSELRSLLVDGARRAGFLDYRVMLRTHLLACPLSRSHDGPALHDIIYGSESQGLEEQLFDLVSLVILAGVRTTVAGGTEATIGELMRKVWENRPANRRKGSLERANVHANTFNQAFNAKLLELETKLAVFLNYFENHLLTIKIQPVSIAWDKESLKLDGAELIPEITFRGKPVSEYQLFLNEARLSALAICLFLAGVVLSDNDYGNPAYPRFLFLDDALIGLELENRIPILRILASNDFANYQIFLLTHDRVWYDIARGQLPESNGWLHRELTADEARGFLVPRMRPGLSDLARAREHLANGDLRATAVYARAALEARLRNVCQDRGIEVKYRKDPKEISLDKLWSALVARQKEREQDPGSADFIPRALITEVDAMRSNVLNALSHASSPDLNKVDLTIAINTVMKLQNHPFPKP